MGLVHRIYFDEDIYANTAQNMAFTGQTGMANYGSFEYGEYFVNWFGYLRTRAARHLFLLAMVLPFACYMRPESSLIALWALAAVSFNLFSTGSDPEPPFRHPFATRSFWATGLIAFALIIPHIWHFFAMSGQSWGGPGAKFSTSFFANNLTVNDFYFLNNKAFPILFTLLALVGLAAWKIRPGRGGEKIGPGGVSLMLLWFLLFWGIFLFFYAGSYKYGADVRFALVCFMPLTVLVGLGGDALREWMAAREDAPQGQGETGVAILMLLLLFCWLKFVPLVRLVGQEAWGARYDHKYSHEFIKKIPNRSMVVTHIPTMFLLWGQNAIQSYAGINNPDLIRDLIKRHNSHVYFHKNFWCNALNDANKTICDGISLRYDLEPVAVAREQSYEYGLYHMTFKK